MTVPTVLVFPGASLMDISAGPEGIAVRCPGCEARELWRPEAGAFRVEAFHHEDGCPVHARILVAIRQYARQAVRRG